jgi:hypothetical protein
MLFGIPTRLHQLFRSIISSEQRFDPNAQLPSFENIIRDAQVLLSYAATAGVTLSDSDVATLTAVGPADNLKTKEFILAYSKIALPLLPVTAFTLRQFFSNYRQTLRFYVIWGTLLAIVVVFFSVLTFISSSLSASINTEIDLANSKAITLQAHLGISPDATLPTKPSQFVQSTSYSLQDLLVDLQQFAISLRFIDSRAQELRHLVFFLGVIDQFADQRSNPKLLEGQFELDPIASPTANFLQVLQTYQPVRAYAQNLRDGVTFWYGGVAASILPVLYAILGVCALSLRRMQIAIRDKTFADAGTKEHLLVAVIAGMLITLFSPLFVTSGVSLPPLALAFLAGYSSDAFFQVLEGVIRPRTQVNSSVPPPTA